MKSANRLNAVWTVIIGEEELERKVAVVRHMESGRQEEVPLDSVMDWLGEQLAATSCQGAEE